jgi:cellulose synthase/poly-beta-1,6-N-acetylglucosamine synthase-like glycosyltransferase
VRGLSIIRPLSTLRARGARSYRVAWKKSQDPRWLPALLYLYLVSAIVFLVWRTSIVNWDIWYGPLLYFAELYGLVTTALFLFMAQRIYTPVYRYPSQPKTVDVLIPTYSEPLQILEPVIIGAKNIIGVGNILVLDDGNRPEVKEMAARQGVKYYPRTTNLHAKAGNLNNGLAHTKAEFLILLDADHIPLPTFIKRTLGYFDDPNLAIVQTPQTFYNTSSFLFRKWHSKHAGWSEQLMFYSCIQPAKNRWNAAFFVGTSAMLRRKAVDSVGGFATGTATEDIHTSLRIHAKGWKSVFLQEVMAYGLEAESFREFYKQRQRWAAGSLGLLLRSSDSPLRANHLTLGQRLNYLSASLAHLQGVQKILFFIIPIATMLTGVSPLHGPLGLYSVVFICFLSLSMGTTWVYSRGTYHPLYNEAYSLANAFAHLGGIKGVIKVQKKFAVSRKNAKKTERTALTKILWSLCVITFVAVFWDGWQFFQDHRHYAVLIYSLFFMMVNVTVLLSFLVYLHKYERYSSRTASYDDLTPQALYTYIINSIPKSTTETPGLAESFGPPLS